MPFLVILTITFIILGIFAILAFVEAMRLLACGLVMLCLFALLGI